MNATSLSRSSVLPERVRLMTSRTSVWGRDRGSNVISISSGGHVSGYARRYAPQLVRFVVIGALLALLNLSFLYGLRTWLRLSDPVAVTGMYVLGAIAHFCSHRWITYGAQDQPVQPQLMRYVLMLVWNFVIMQTVVAVTARVGLSPYLAVMGATGLTMVSNFLLMTHVVFERERRR
jgi:putative flippase GtrA